ncbi:MAG: glutamate-5-semialdehyde dehydrogenase, partial [Candidatus Binataceae bacterium]
MKLEDHIIGRLSAARRAAHALALAPTERKNRALTLLSTMLREACQPILAANREDLAVARAEGNTAAFIERLTLDQTRVAAMAHSLEEIVALADPNGETIAHWRRPNGLEIAQVRVALGVIAIIYESRPNVTI